MQDSRREGHTHASVQAQIQAVWRDVLEIDEVGIDHSFFDLGGESLSGMLCVHRIQAEFRVAIPLSVLLDEGMTVRALAQRIHAAAALRT